MQKSFFYAKKFFLMRIPLQHTISILFMPLARTAVETARITVQVTCSSKTKPEMQIETLKNQQSMIAVTSNITSEDIVCTVPDLALIRSVGQQLLHFASTIATTASNATCFAIPMQVCGIEALANVHASTTTHSYEKEGRYPH